MCSAQESTKRKGNLPCFDRLVYTRVSQWGSHACTFDEKRVLIQVGRGKVGEESVKRKRDREIEVDNDLKVYSMWWPFQASVRRPVVNVVLKVQEECRKSVECEAGCISYLVPIESLHTILGAYRALVKIYYSCLIDNYTVV